MGKAPTREFMEKIESTAKLVKGVLGIHDLRAEYVGPDMVHTGFHIEAAKGTTIEEADELQKRSRRKSASRLVANTA